MGVPKFFRWISERYPRVNQRYGRVPEADRIKEHFGAIPSSFPAAPDELSTCAMPPPIDRLYIDMNGIIHGCSHNNNDGDDDTEGVAQITEAEVFRNICYYLDRIVSELAHPNGLVYMAVDGVAPRAKLNQQRSRRYRSGKEGLIEQTIYEAHTKKKMSQEMIFTAPGTGEAQDTNEKEKSMEHFEEVEPGRFAGKVLAHWDQQADPGMQEDLFHSNNITPGTPFFERCTAAIEHFVQRKISEDPNWKNLTVIFSGASVPGEGEHKIMQFMREQRTAYEEKVANNTLGDVDPNNPMEYHPNLRHCIMGQDGDLIILGLALHEPNLVLLREQVLFDARRRAKAEDLAASIDSYLFNPNFEFLHMNILRDYLAYEFETSNVIKKSSWDIEHCIDDFVLLSFLVGMDFLPGLPALDIADEAYDLLFYTYRDKRKKWKKEQGNVPYLTDHGSIVSGSRLEDFLQSVGKHETTYFDFKRSMDDIESDRKLEAKYGMSTIPSDDVIADKEYADRAAFRERVSVDLNEEGFPEGFAPVVSAQLPEDNESAEAMTERMGGLLRIGIGGKDLHVDENDTKGRYYSDKFGFSPFDAEKHIALRKAYVEGLVWCLKYYYEGCVSWEWYFPYHYGPMLSDIIGVENMLKELSFENRIGEPLRPFEQLLACMPPNFAEVLPEPYRVLMTESSSPIADFYPLTFTIDMNGKRWPWEAVVLLPFIESKRLLEASRSVGQALLSDEEKRRNEFGRVVVFQHDVKTSKTLQGVGTGPMFTTLPDCKTVSLPFEETSLQYTALNTKPLLKPKLIDGVEVPLPAFPTLRDGTVVGLWRKQIRVNVHGTKSRYKTACLEIDNPVPEAIFSLEMLASKLIGKLIWINYPHFIQAFVTAVSDNHGYIRGQDPKMHRWSAEERTLRRKRVTKVTNQYVFGEAKVGTGGIGLADGGETMDALEKLIYVRPVAGFRKLSDGTVGKVFAKFEVEVPLFVTGWTPQKVDQRLANLPVLLEKDPYKQAKLLLTDPKRETSTDSQSRNFLLSSSNHVFRVPLQARSFHNMPAKSVGTWRRSITSSKIEMRGGAVPRTFHSTAHPGMSTSRPMKPSNLTNRKFSFVSMGTVLIAALCTGIASATSFASSNVGGLHSLRSAVDRSAMLTDTHLSPRPLDFGKSDPLEYSHGTTTLAFTFSGGVVVAADSRASMGSFVGSKTTQKILPINSHVLGTMAGSAGDLMFWIRVIRCEAAQHGLAEGRRMSVARASRLLSNALYEYRGMDLSIGTLISGFDDTGNGQGIAEPKIYYVDSTGLRLKGDSFSVGSGSTLALGIIDEERRYDMTESEAIALGIKAIKHATFRDANSGGFINVYIIKPDEGWKLVFTQDLDSLNHRSGF